MELKKIKRDLVIKVNENIPECRKFVEDNHYTKNYGRGGRYYISLWYQEEMCGVGIWRQPNGRLTYKLFNTEFVFLWTRFNPFSFDRSYAKKHRKLFSFKTD